MTTNATTTTTSTTTPTPKRAPRPLSLAYRTAAGKMQRMSTDDAGAEDFRTAIKMLEIAAKGYEAEAATKAGG